MDRPKAQELHSAFRQVLQDFALKNNLRLSAENCKFGPANINFRIEFQESGVEIKMVDLAQKPVGAEFNYRGEVYVKTGVKWSYRKYPILANRKYDGRGFKFPLRIKEY